GVVAVGLALGVLELPGLRGGVGDLAGDAALGAEVVDPAGQGASLDDDDRGAMPFEEPDQLGAAGGEGVGARRAVGGVVGTGDALVLAQVEGENGAGRGGGVRGRHGASSCGVSGTG